MKSLLRSAVFLIGLFISAQVFAAQEFLHRPQEIAQSFFGEGHVEEQRDDRQHHVEQHQCAGHRQREGQRGNLARERRNSPFDDRIDDGQRDHDPPEHRDAEASHHFASSDLGFCVTR